MSDGTNPRNFKNKNIAREDVRKSIGYSGNNANKVDYLLNLRQRNSDKIRDYFDKYREAYNRTYRLRKRNFKLRTSYLHCYQKQ